MISLRTSLCSASYVSCQRGTARICCCAPWCGAAVVDRRAESFDISCSPGPKQQTRSNAVRRANGTDRRANRHTDGRTPYRYIDPAPRALRAVPITGRSCRSYNSIDPSNPFAMITQLTYNRTRPLPVMRYVMCKRPLSIVDRFDSALEVFLNDMRYINPRFTYLLTYSWQLITMVCRGYGDPHGDTHGYGYEDRYSVPTAALLITMASA